MKGIDLTLESIILSIAIFFGLLSIDTEVIVNVCDKTSKQEQFITK